MKRLITFFILCFVVGACNEDEIKATGDLVVKVNFGITGETQYALFTEAAYLDGSYLPLQEGSIISNNTPLTFRNLLPGTYVVEFYFNNAIRFVGQVVPGETSTIDAKL